MQEGMIGLYRAVTDYRAGGLSFKNFAYLCIQPHQSAPCAVRRGRSTRRSTVPCRSRPKTRGNRPCTRPRIRKRCSSETRSAASFSPGCAGRFPPFEYRALTLYIEGLSIAEIAARERRSEKSADNAVQRAKRKAAALFGSQKRDGTRGSRR